MTPEQNHQCSAHARRVLRREGSWWMEVVDAALAFGIIGIVIAAWWWLP